MRNAGIFSSNKQDLEKQFQDHAASVMFYEDSGYKINTREKTITAGEVVWRYIYMGDWNDCQKISGFEFAAIFVDETIPKDCKQFIRSRWRF